MSHYIVNENEFKHVVSKIYLEEQKNILNEKWSKLSKDEKIFISVKLKGGVFKEVRYDKNKNISHITEHGKVYLYPRN